MEGVPLDLFLRCPKKRMNLPTYMFQTCFSVFETSFLSSASPTIRGTRLSESIFQTRSSTTADISYWDTEVKAELVQISFFFMDISVVL